MKKGARSAHQYADWDKLEKYGWKRGAIPLDFKHKPDDEIWWPRNSQSRMSVIAQNAGWRVIEVDLGLLQRDSIILLERP